MEIPMTELKVVMLYDMLEACEPELEERVRRRFDDHVPFGDGEYTIVKWYKAERFFYAALYEHGLSQAEASNWMSRYNDIVGNDGVLVG